VTAAAVSVPAARTLRRRLRRVRSAHRDTSLAGILTDVYMGVMAVAIYGTAAVTVIRRHLRLPPTASAADSGVRAALLFAAALVTAGLGWQTARSLGPLYLTGAGRYWAAGTPVDRAGWLRPALGWVVLAGAGGGALLGFLVGLVGADAGGPIAGTVTTAAAAGAGLAAATVIAQSRIGLPAQARGGAGSDAGAIRVGVGTALVGVGFAVALAVIALDAGGVHPSLPAVPVWWCAGAALLLAAAAAMTALRRLGRLDAAALTGGAQLADAATLAAVFLQPAMLSDIIELRRWRRVGRVRSRPFGRPPALVAAHDRYRRMWTLVHADLRRQWRRPTSAVAWAALLVVPYATVLLAPAAAAPVRVVAGYLATQRLCAGLRTVCRSAALRRTLGGSDRLLRGSHLVVPGIALAVWWAATAPVLGRFGQAEPVLALGVLFACYRSASRQPTSYDGVAVDTPFGLMQPALLTQLVRGFDVLAVVALVAFVLR